MPTEPLLLFGASGHAKVVLDALLAGGRDRAGLQASDDDPALHGSDFLGLPVRAPADCDAHRFHVAIGSAAARERVQRRLQAQGRTAVGVLHPRACVSPLAALGAGVFVAAQAVVAPAARLGEGVIVNHGAVVDHDCEVGAFSHVAPRATLGGNVRVGQRVLVGAGAIVLPGVAIGDDCTIGAGAVVTANVEAGGTWVGVPARRLRREAR